MLLNSFFFLNKIFIHEKTVKFFKLVDIIIQNNKNERKTKQKNYFINKAKNLKST